MREKFFQQFSSSLSKYTDGKKSSVTSVLTIRDRMFRAKPYTQCMLCIKDNERIRCQQCMKVIISEISQNQKLHSFTKNKKSPKKAFYPKNDEQSIPSLFKTNVSSHKGRTYLKQETTQGDFFGRKISAETLKNNKNQEQQGIRIRTGNQVSKMMITSKYRQWMSDQQRKKQLNVTTSCWPRKTKNHDYNLDKYGVKQPKFEKWEKKLLDQLMAKTKQLR